MRHVTAFLRFWYDFIVGDDWTIAIGVAAIMTATWGPRKAGLDVWWLYLLAIIALLATTILRVARGTRPH
ncbi:MAG: hypothetical protein QM589_02005 [Thermomicrobiales bacterium]